MATAGKSFCLRSNRFPDIVCQSLKVLRSGQDFADVTLACEDGDLVEAHKVILAGGSPFFARLLKKLDNPHPLIYLKDVTLESLLALLDFVYTGEAEVAEEGVPELLQLADQLEIAGLKSDEGEEHKSDNKVKEEENMFESQDDVTDQSQLVKIKNSTDIFWGVADVPSKKNSTYLKRS